MKWANFLHVYQPFDQKSEVLDAIIAQSYRPIFQALVRSSSARVSLNVTGALLELFDKNGHRDLIDLLRKAGSAGHVEFTGSAKFHALLPFQQESEIVRQITANNETNRYYLGESYHPRGFFPPEMAYSDRVGQVVAEQGFDWMVLDEIAYGGIVGRISDTAVYQLRGTKLKLLLRQRRLSNLIMSAVVRTVDSLKESLGPQRDDTYVVTAMDGETFGHHRPGLEQMLFSMLDDPSLNLCALSDVVDAIHRVEEIQPVASTWASSEEDIKRNVQFLSWKDPQNPIHAWQWQFVGLVQDEVHALNSRDPAFPKARKLLDSAIASDHLWWASAKPWWSLEMIEDGAYRLLETIRSIPHVAQEKLDRARELYEKIVSTAFQWQRSGHIEKLMKEQSSILRIPFKDRTVGRGGAERGVYDAFVSMMHRLEQEAAQRKEYERAILWRDAVYKLERKHDIYDAVNAIELLRTQLPNEEVERVIEQYKDRYRQIRGGQPEQRGS